MTLLQRDNQIKKYRFTHKWPYKKIANKYNISIERVRQICLSPEEKKNLLEEVKVNYKNKFKDSPKNLLEDIVELSQPSRKKEVVLRRNYLISYLYDELEIVFPKIAVLLNKDHTTIIHAYNSYHKKNE